MKTVKLSPIKMSDGMERLSELQKEVNEKYAANKKLYRSSGRGQWNKKAVEIMNKCMENNSEQQIIIKNASKKLTKEILKTGIGKQVKIKEHTPLRNVPVAPTIPKDHLKTCTNILIDGMIKEGAKKMRKLIRATNYKTGQSVSLPTINEREQELMNSTKRSSGGFPITDPRLIKAINKKELLRKEAESQISKVPIYYNEIKKPIKVIKKGYKFTKGFLKLKQEPVFDVEFCLGKNALKEYLKPAKKKRIPTRFNAKKLKEKHSDLWEKIANAVHSDIEMQANLLISEYRKNKNISENAAFTAIVEMIKRGLL